MKLLNAVLDRAEKRTWIMMLGIISFGFGIGMLSEDGSWGWLYAAFGFLLALIHPAATTVRGEHRSRALMREIEDHLMERK